MPRLRQLRPSQRLILFAAAAMFAAAGLLTASGVLRSADEAKPAAAGYPQGRSHLPNRQYAGRSDAARWLARDVLSPAGFRNSISSSAISASRPMRSN